MPNKKDKIFNVQHQYELYLQRIALSEDTMHPEQRRQVKQAFFGAWGQLLIHMREEISDLEIDDGIEVLDSQLHEVGDYFLTIGGQKN